MQDKEVREPKTDAEIIIMLGEKLHQSQQDLKELQGENKKLLNDFSKYYQQACVAETQLYSREQDLKVAVEALEEIKATITHNTNCIANMKYNIIGLTDVQIIATQALAKLRKE